MPVLVVTAVVATGEAVPEIVVVLETEYVCGDVVGVSELLWDPPREPVKLFCPVAVPGLDVNPGLGVRYVLGVAEVVGVTNLLPLIDRVDESETL